MNDEDVEIRISEEEIAPLVPEDPPTPTIKERAGQAAQQAGQQATAAAHKVWQSETRKKVTHSVGSGARKAVKKGGQAVTGVMVRTAERQARQQSAAMRQRLQETDWKQVSREGAAGGLRWLSRQFARLAARFTPKQKGD